MRILAYLFVAACLSVATELSLHAQPTSKLAVRCGRLIDGRGGPPVSNVTILVEGNKIVSISHGDSTPADAQVIDLSHQTVLPGLIDAHTHIFLQGDSTDADYADQLLKESIPYRALLAARSARIALDHGFTTLRDLETEGAMYADVDVKTAIERHEIPGPRLFVATRGLSPTGTYPLLGYSWELNLPHGVQIVDGPQNARLAVREQISHGADVIKFYADHDTYWGTDGILHGPVNFTDEEARAIVDEAHRHGRKAAAHARSADGIAAALRAGVDSIEHGIGFTDALLKQAAAQHVYWVPTAMIVAGGPEPLPDRKRMADAERTNFPKAIQDGVRIVFGTDAGGFAWTAVNEAGEFSYYVKYGMTPMQAIQAATSSAADLLGQSASIGTLEPGKFGDLIAVDNDPLTDITELQRVQFVMKDGIVYKSKLGGQQ